MTVRRREYRSQKNKGPVWGYAFSHNKVRYRKAGFTSRAEALQAEAKMRQQLTGKRARPVPKSALTVRMYIPKFLESRRVERSQVTFEKERRRARPIVRVLGKRKIQDVTPGDIHDYVAQRKADGLANRSVNLELTLLRSFFKFAKGNQLTEDNPAKEVTNLRVVRHEHWIPTQDEFRRFMDAAAKSPSAKFLVPWLWFRAFTGTRHTESFHVQWRDIDFDKEQIRIAPKDGHPLKNARFRVVEMHPTLKPVLLNWRREWEELYERHRRRFPDSPEHDWVFVSPKNHGARARAYRRSFHKARTLAELPQMRSHTLRHFFISFCVMGQIDFFTIARWVGHSSSAMIEQTYGHLTSEFRATQMRKLQIVAPPDTTAAEPQSEHPRGQAADGGC